MQEKIQNIIYSALQNLSDELEKPELKNPTLQTKIYGEGGNLDSLALVSFITDVEELITKEFNQNIILADEKAMSLRNSPFRDVASLTFYIQGLLKI